MCCRTFREGAHLLRGVTIQLHCSSGEHHQANQQLHEKSLAQRLVQLAPNATQEEGVKMVETGGRLPSNEPKLQASQNQSEVSGQSLTALVPHSADRCRNHSYGQSHCSTRHEGDHREAARQDQGSDPAPKTCQLQHSRQTLLITQY